jgi:hypothetical protein
MLMFMLCLLLSDDKQTALQQRVTAAEAAAAAATAAAASSKASSLKAAEATITELGTRLAQAHASLARQAQELAVKDKEVRVVTETSWETNTYYYLFII